MPNIKIKNTWIYGNKRYNPGDIVKDVPEHVLSNIKNGKNIKVDFDLVNDKGIAVTQKEEVKK